MEPSRFVYQKNQFWASCEPCTPSVFNKLVRSQEVAWKIGMRQAVERAVTEGLPLDDYLRDTEYHKWCVREAKRKNFAALTDEKKLLQWVQSLKSSLPAFVFAVKEFGLVPKTDKNGNPVLDPQGKPFFYRRRKQENILHLSGLFMSDFDHLSFPPEELFVKTQVKGFPWKVLLGHKTSSGNGLRTVSEWNLDCGNIADNQYLMAKELGMLDVIGTTGKHICDNSCINADRISYCPRLEDIIFVNEDELFNK